MVLVKLAPCPSALEFGRAIAKAVIRYVESVPNLPRTSSPAVLVVVSEQETNIFDQRAIEESVLRANPAIKIIRRTFKQLSETTGIVKIEENSRRLFVSGLEIAVIYFRTGYAPEHFDEENWQTKLRLELSFAIKCPTVDYLLANMKLVQTALANPKVLSLFEKKLECPNRLAATFARQTVLSTDFPFSDSSAINDLIAECRHSNGSFVLKPQREGGGNNIFGGNIVKKLDEILSTPAASTYILMEKLKPPIVENCLVGADYPPPLRRPMVSELGIFGVLLSCGVNILENHSAGHLLRTKFVDVDEGGVVTGFASLDTPFLI